MHEHLREEICLATWCCVYTPRDMAASRMEHQVRRNRFPIAIMIFIVIGVAFGLMLFKSCYDDHRNQLGFSVMSSIASCSG